jgi:hypothetical protein
MHPSSDSVIDKIRVREVAGVFRSRDALEAAVDALFMAGFDRADVDVIAGVDAVREKLGTFHIAAEDLADMPSVPRRAITQPSDTVTLTALVAGVLSFVAAAAAALFVIASGRGLVPTVGAAIVAGGIGAALGALLVARLATPERLRGIEPLMAELGLILWVRVRSPEQERKAEEVLRGHGAQAVRVHEIDVEKRSDDIPLSSLRPDPWLGEERLGDV